eukprot:gnl/MRDRNA2_/MRDRNA2_23044_c0_seq1.p1 gnl/MRDRNA2_/MRDRNA2_23044_c0~~gnl/MRDRNA2_/MRDRNA2_23044_c0_seq1.p1  ORF type:complete len:249 (-),score=36.77 gnl/MRDRNA2_/MRDRNA2_23044_c0_seq1:142-888(-)
MHEVTLDAWEPTTPRRSTNLASVRPPAIEVVRKWSDGKSSTTYEDSKPFTPAYSESSMGSCRSPQSPQTAPVKSGISPWIAEDSGRTTSGSGWKTTASRPPSSPVSPADQVGVKGSRRRIGDKQAAQVLGSINNSFAKRKPDTSAYPTSVTPRNQALDDAKEIFAATRAAHGEPKSPKTDRFSRLMSADPMISSPASPKQSKCPKNYKSWSVGYRATAEGKIGEVGCPDSPRTPGVSPGGATHAVLRA